MSTSTNSEWYWAKRGSDERNGPVSRSRLEELAGEGDLEPDDLVWKEGMDDWQKANSVEELESLFATPPSLPDDSEEEDSHPEVPKTKLERVEEEYELPMEFKVEWGGLLLTNESILQLRESGVTLRTDDTDFGGEVDYRHIEIGEIDDNSITLKAPFGFSKDNAGKAKYISSKNHHLTFKSKDSLKKAIGAIGGVKREEMDTENQANVETTDDEEKVTAGDGGEDPFWKRHPIWTGVIAVFLLGALSNALDSGSGGTNSSEATSSCKAEAGVYSGNYTAATPSGPEQGEASFILSDDCSYTISMDGSRMGTGQAVSTSDGSFELENGNTIRIDGGTARMEENGSNYQVTYEMRKVE